MKAIFTIQFRDRHREILRMISGHRFKFIGSMICSLIIAGTTAATAWLVEPVVDEMFTNKNLFMIRMIPVAIIVMYLIRGIGVFGQEYLMSYVGQDIIRQLRNRLYGRIQDLPISFFQAEKTGVLMSRITHDVNLIKNMVSDTVKGSIRDIFSILSLTVVIFYRDWQLALIALVVIPLTLLPIVKFGRRVRKVSTRNQETMAELNAFLHETISGNKIVKAFGMEPYEKKRFGETVMRIFRLEVKTAKAKALSPSMMEAIAGLGSAFVFWYGAIRVFNGTSTLGNLLSFLTAVLLLYDPIKKLTKANNAIQEGLAAADRVFDIVETETTIRERENPVALAREPHRVSFENVFFRYDTVDVLKDIHLDISPGETLALVGMSGGGKSSMVNLIPRFFDVYRGAIRVDGHDIRDVSIKSLRDQIAIVSQEPILFNDTVRNNIAYGNPAATDEEIYEAARAAYAFDFIQNFPKGFNTTIGELGGRLSGGEKQRICIARAFLKNAPILILDEATSALDTESEMWVQKALENLIRGRTTFVIAHRLSTIANAHRIIVLVGGRIVEEGSHETLMARNGEYCKLHRMQFSDRRSLGRTEAST
jgi:subfamily B ATP-binding cassette protein MsbA